MILDNKNTNLKVHEWIVKYTKEGKFSLVSLTVALRITRLLMIAVVLLILRSWKADRRF